MRHEDWKDICSRCGLCCHEKVVLDDMVIIDLDKACEFYNEDEKSCKVYEDRFSYCDRCRKINARMAMFSPMLPPTCSYVKWAKDRGLRFAKRRELVIGNLD